MADRDLVEVRQPAEQDEIIEVQIVSGVHAETEGSSQARGIGIGLERGLARVIAMLEGTGERLRVELDAVRANVRGPSNRRLLRVDEDADTDAVTLETAHDGGHRVPWRVRRPSRPARDPARLHRH